MEQLGDAQALRPFACVLLPAHGPQIEREALGLAVVQPCDEVSVGRTISVKRAVNVAVDDAWDGVSHGILTRAFQWTQPNLGPVTIILGAYSSTVNESAPQGSLVISINASNVTDWLVVRGVVQVWL